MTFLCLTSGPNIQVLIRSAENCSTKCRLTTHVNYSKFATLMIMSDLTKILRRTVLPNRLRIRAESRSGLRLLKILLSLNRSVEELSGKFFSPDESKHSWTICLSHSRFTISTFLKSFISKLSLTIFLEALVTKTLLLKYLLHTLCIFAWFQMRQRRLAVRH